MKKILVFLAMSLLVFPIVFSAVQFPILTINSPYGLQLAWWINDSQGELYMDNGFLRANISASSGDITAVNTDGPYLIGGASSGEVNLTLNDSYLNSTIDARDSDTTYTASTGLSLAGTVFSLAWQFLSNFTDDLGDRGYNSLSNFSNDIDLINGTYGNNTYILQSNEGNLNVNSSGYWDSLNSPSDITGLGDSQITSLSWIRLNNYPGACNSNETITTLADTVLCTAINITEAQITDLVHTTDTVWTLTAPYLFNNSGGLDFNETKLNSTIDLRTASTTYNASSITTLEGTLDGGDLTSIQSIDTNFYNVSESSGGSPLLVEINFTNVTSFDSVLLRIQYSGTLGHEVEIQTRNYDSSTWEVAGSITDQSSMTEIVINILDSADHVSGGDAVVRFDHVQNGVSSHDLFIDYVALQKGFTSITNFEHDSLLGRDNESNHPWALPISGVRNMSGDLNVGGNDLVNVLINWSYLQNYPSACSASQYISALGDGLSCASISITESQVSDLDHYDLNVSSDSGTGTILDSEVFALVGGGVVSTAMSGNTLTITGSTHTVDTNETTRVNNLAGFSCSGTNKTSSFDANLNPTCTTDVDTTYTNGSAISLVGNQFNLSTCADNQIWKMSGTVWNCEADDAGAGAYEFNVTGDSGTQQTINTGDVLDIAGGTNGIDTVVGATDTVTINLDWTEVGNDAISEAKIDMDTACAAGNHLYVSGNDFACEVDDDTTYSASGTLLDLTGTTFSVNEGTLTTTKWCKYISGTGIVCNVEPVTDTNETSRVNALNATKANIGDCGSGEYVQNTTITGVECGTPPDLQGVTSVTGTSPIVSGGGTTPAISITLLGDLITTSPITGGVNNIFPGSGTKATIGITVLKDLVAGDGLSGGENNVFVGGDADTTLTLGTPSTLTASTSNAVTATSHTHAITTDSSGACASGVICAGDHTHPASQVTTGTFGTGNYVMDTNLTVEKLVFEVDTANHVIYDNSTCIIIKAGTTTLEVCE